MFCIDNRSSLDLFVPGRIREEDAMRQTLTSVEIIKRFDSQPGLILADEVGMGKTFIALSVAAAVHFNDPARRPVIVMVPRSLAEKWPRDASIFKERCLRGRWSEEFSFTQKPLESGIELLKAIGGEGQGADRYSLIFITHGALYRSLRDGWVKLAIMRQALKRQKNVEDIRRALGRFAGRILKMRGIAEDVWEALLDKDPEDWPALLARRHPKAPLAYGEELVPRILWDAITHADSRGSLRRIRKILDDIPRRVSEKFEDNLDDLRARLTQEIDGFWSELKGRIETSLPLLIFDEAHHLKNPTTKLRKSLFQNGDDSSDETVVRGVFYGVFTNMLFLTATPFQLGHHELLSVLELFKSANWEGRKHGGNGLYEYGRTLEILKVLLDRSQERAIALDAAWGRLRSEDLCVDGQVFTDADAWYTAINGPAHSLSDRAAFALDLAEATGKDMKEAERALRPWVIRHLKPRDMRVGNATIARRKRFTGSEILEPAGSPAGIEVEGDARLPFLLAARTVALTPSGRAVFAEGLASSYEAFLETRKNRSFGLDTDEDPFPTLERRDSKEEARLSWYAGAIEEALRHKHGKGAPAHPKVDATVTKVRDLWLAGEKVVVFCHYLETGKALRARISEALWKAIIDRALLSWPKESPGNVESRLEKFGKSFFVEDSRMRRHFDERVRAIARECTGGSDLGGDGPALVETVRRFVRTPSFLIRYFDLSGRLSPDSIDAAFERPDASGMTLASMLKDFFSFLNERCDTGERKAYLEALNSVMTGSHFITAKNALEGEMVPRRSLANVRLVNGSTQHDARLTLMLTFNTPFFPEVLVASSVLAEGVDLQLNCRHIVHHDLCWNPSTIEQRTGRVDRIGAKADRCGRSIVVYLPFVAGTQDEKMYRVMADRERWFKVVMGEEFVPDPSAVEQISSRVLLPLALGERLAFNLACWSSLAQG
jgi:hypothetical protein